MALQLAVCVESLADGEAECSCSCPGSRPRSCRGIDFAVGDRALRGASLIVTVATGATYEAACAFMLVVANQQAVLVVLAADALFRLAALQALFFRAHAAHRFVLDASACCQSS